jgi:hypothetical protein
VLHAEWQPDGRGCRLVAEESWIGSARLVDDWYEPGDVRAQSAWVVEWPDRDARITQRALVELDGRPAATEERMADLSEKAMRVAEAGPPPTPAGFAIASTGKGSTAELRDRIELTSHALQAAEARLNGAARREDEHAAVLIAIALTETLMWVRTLDDVMNDAWQRDLPSSVREAASQRVDEYVARRPHLADAMRPVREQRRRTGEPYSDWTQLLIGKGLFVPRAKLKGLRWVAGKTASFRTTARDRAPSLARRGCTTMEVARRR